MASESVGSLFFEVNMDSNLQITFKNNSQSDIYIDNDFSNLAVLVNEKYDYNKKILILTDSNVEKLYLQEVKDLLNNTKSSVFEFVLEAGEESKNLDNVIKCYNALIDNSFSKSDIIIALGGGVVTDLAGFAAATYKRGIILINVPTTLLAMCDAGIGGKCGVDFNDFKNSIGSVYLPQIVYMASKALVTLDNRNYSSGIAEVLKAGLIKDGALYEWMINNFNEIMDKDMTFVNEMIFKAVSIKQFFVTKDPFDTAERRMLNFGHTIGHALEEYFNFKYSHGECVCLGIIAASYIAFKRQMLSTEEFYEIRDMFVPFDLPISLDEFDTDKVYSIIGNDKKIDKNGLNFVLLKKIGKAVIVNDVTKEELLEAINSLIVKWD